VPRRERKRGENRRILSLGWESKLKKMIAATRKKRFTERTSKGKEWGSKGECQAKGKKNPLAASRL